MADNAGGVQVRAELTPNPDTVKFIVNRTFFPSGSCNFPDRTKASDSLLASHLFQIQSVQEVMIGTNFVSVTKSSNADWQGILPQVNTELQKFLETNQPVVSDSLLPNESPSGEKSAGIDSDIETKIKKILDEEIRPAIAMDGGDVVYHGFQEGVVQLHLQGACRSCPSATMTLRMGIEARLKQAIPEVKEVVPV